MSTLLEMLKKLFRTPTGLESYVASKNPNNHAEVEFWIKQYTYNKFGSLN